MDLARALKTSANLYMAARLVKRVSADVVKQSPYQALGAVALLAVLAGVAMGRRRTASAAP